MKNYEGRDVTDASIKVTNAGDGLSKALGIEPVEYPLESTVHVVLECEVARISYEEIKDSGGLLRRVHTLKAGTGTIVDASLVADLMVEQRRKIAEAEGVHELPLDDEPDDAEGDE